MKRRFMIDGEEVTFDDGTVDPDSRACQVAQRVIDAIDRFADAMASIPPFSWLDWFLRGPVGPKR